MVCFLKFSFLLDLTICFYLKSTGPLLKFRINFNQERHAIFLKSIGAIRGHFVFREFN